MKAMTRGEAANAAEDGKSEPTDEEAERTFTRWQAGMEPQF